MAELTVRDAVKVAIDEVTALFDEQSISNVLLEEVDKNPQGDFLITVGFDRQASGRAAGVLGGGLAAILARDRVYKVVRVDAENGIVNSIKDRILERK